MAGAVSLDTRGELPVRLRAMLTERLGAPVSLSAVSTRQNSAVFRADIDAPSRPRHLAVKCCFLPRSGIPDPVVAGAQYAAYERTHLAMQGEHRAPAPLLFDAPLAAFVMDWVDGPSLTRRLAEPLAPLHLVGDFARVGAWLGSFHCCGPLRAGRFDYAQREAHLRELAEDPLPDDAYGEACTALTAARESVEGQPVQVSWLHGDCKTDNFLLAEGATYGIDLSLAHENAVEHDLAQFLNHLELLLTGPRGLHLRPLRGIAQRAFWSGYRSTGPHVSTVCLAWVRLWSLLSMWQTSIRTPGRSRLGQWALGEIFQRACGQLTRSLAMVGLREEIRSALPRIET